MDTNQLCDLAKLTTGELIAIINSQAVTIDNLQNSNEAILELLVEHCTLKE